MYFIFLFINGPIAYILSSRAFDVLNADVSEWFEYSKKTSLGVQLVPCHRISCDLWVFTIPHHLEWSSNLLIGGIWFFQTQIPSNPHSKLSVLHLKVDDVKRGCGFLLGCHSFRISFVVGIRVVIVLTGSNSSSSLTLYLRKTCFCWLSHSTSGCSLKKRILTWPIHQFPGERSPQKASLQQNWWIYEDLVYCAFFVWEYITWAHFF